MTTEYKDGVMGSEQRLSVSVWRKLFIANKWKDLQVRSRGHTVGEQLLISAIVMGNR
jgi:hypothetical protein